MALNYEIIDDIDKKAFVKFFKTRSFVESKLSELDPIRNATAYSHTVTRHSSDKLRIYSTEIQACMKVR